MTPSPGRVSPSERLEAAAISMRMIDAVAAGGPASVSVLAQRFAVDEAALRKAVGSRAVDRVYDRIHANGRPASPGLVEAVP